MSEQQKKIVQVGVTALSVIVAIVMATFTISTSAMANGIGQKQASLELRMDKTDDNVAIVMSQVSGIGPKLDTIASNQDALMKMFVAHIEKGSR